MILKNENIRRCAIFLFFDKDGVVDDYICQMLEDLRKSVEYILVIGNGYIEREGLEKLKTYSDDIYCRANLGLDVGGYREGLFYIGFKKLAEFDEVILMNYTFFGPLYPFSEMFDEMKERDVDFWGITKHHKVDPDPFGMLSYGYLPEHIQSFFLVMRPSLFLSYHYKDFIFNMQNPESYQKSIVEYETILTKHFEDLGFKWAVYVNTDEYEGYAYCPNMFYIKDLIKKKRCPIIKRRSFFTDYTDFLLNSCGEPSVEAYEYMRDNLDYDEDVIWDNILRLENLGDIQRDMHFNYILPTYGDEEKKPDQGSTAVFIIVEWGKCLGWYRRFLKNIPPWSDVYLLGKDIKAIKEIGQLVFKYTGNHTHNEMYNTEDYSAVLRKISSICCDRYQYIGILHMRDLEKQKPYSNDVSWQYSDWENILGNKAYMGYLIKVFEENNRLGMLIPPVPNYGRLFSDMGDGWMNHYTEVCQLLQKIQVSVNVKQTSAPLTPIGGSFWIRGKVFSKLCNYLSDVKNTDTETLLLGIPFIVQKIGFYTGIVYSDRYASVEITNQDYMLRENNKVVFEKYGANYHNVCVNNIKDDAFI
ncbi:rhamnan synthesis F family protein [Novisyntrophococcus fermenticellae]|uniref:rhamnan synthesis F family protein n=1 Tax=Novisyntrophococcus fermenticellae TaxID=2068655 RepID=UPI001E30087F|nr:rhamnan synthesis F family protein [Novisyntrophococcus fermenticellae]